MYKCLLCGCSNTRSIPRQQSRNGSKTTWAKSAGIYGEGTRNQLGPILAHADILDQALRHYREAIRHQEIQGNYAGAAVRNLQTYGDRAARAIQKTLQVIADIDSLSKAKGASA